MEETRKDGLVNPLRNERITVRFLPKEGSITDKRHILYGGMIDKAVKTFTVPIISSTGGLKNVLTNSEKEFFESKLGINLSVHNKHDNYWENFKVRLTKGDNYLDLSSVEDYIKYKVLLANTNFICPSLEDLERRHLMTYQYVIIREGQELKMLSSRRQVKKECFKLAGKISDDFEMLKAVIEMLDKRPIAPKTQIEFLRDKLDDFIDNNAQEVYKVLNNPSLASIVFLKRCVGAGLIIKTGDFYYLKSGNSKIPMAEDGRDPEIKQAVKFLDNPRNQEIKFNLEALLKNPDNQNNGITVQVKQQTKSTRTSNKVKDTESPVTDDEVLSTVED